MHSPEELRPLYMVATTCHILGNRAVSSSLFRPESHDFSYLLPLHPNWSRSSLNEEKMAGP